MQGADAGINKYDVIYLYNVTGGPNMYNRYHVSSKDFNLQTIPWTELKNTALSEKRETIE